MYADDIYGNGSSVALPWFLFVEPGTETTQAPTPPTTVGFGPSGFKVGLGLKRFCFRRPRRLSTSKEIKDPSARPAQWVRRAFPATTEPRAQEASAAPKGSRGCQGSWAKPG